jgi:hypothetical protein
VGIGPGLPLLVDFTFPFFNVLEQFGCFGGIDRSANRVFKIGLT